jgi:hypothetical protein
MIELKNDAIRISFSENGGRIELSDLIRGQDWRLDPLSLICESGQGRGLLSPIAVSRAGDNQVELIYGCFGETAAVRYKLAQDYIEITLLADRCGDFHTLALHGSFVPEQADSRKYLLPIMQGMLWDLRGKPFEDRCSHNGNNNFCMAMHGCLAERGAMLSVVETPVDSEWLAGKDGTGRCYVTNLQRISLGRFGYDRAARLYFTEPDITAVAKRYRARVIEKGSFKTWAEKAAERPKINKLFGSLLCMLGYCQTELDYVAECGKLKEMGFDRALVYPMRRNVINYGLTMGGLPQLWLDKDVTRGIKELGYEVAPWTLLSIMLE